MEEQAKPAVVFEHGSHTFKAGLARGPNTEEEERPDGVFPCTVGHPRPMLAGLFASGHYVGEQAARLRGTLLCNEPVRDGRILDWEDMERVWHHAFRQHLRVAPEEQPLLLSDVVPQDGGSVAGDRERMAQLMFERFDVPALHVCFQPLLSLYACGKVSGTVVDCGEEKARVVPVHEGKVLVEGVRASGCGGRALTEYLGGLMVAQGCDPIMNSFHKSVFRHIKEKFCYVALDYESELQIASACGSSSSSSSLEERYELPDGFVYRVNQERFQCPEALFKSSLIGLAHGEHSIHQLALDSITACDAGLQGELFGNVVLCGGTSMFAGFADRFNRELSTLLASSSSSSSSSSSLASLRAKVTAPSQRQYLSWLGGRTIASLPSFRVKMCVSKQEYEENGPSSHHSENKGRGAFSAATKHPSTTRTGPKQKEDGLVRPLSCSAPLSCVCGVLSLFRWQRVPLGIVAIAGLTGCSQPLRACAVVKAIRVFSPIRKKLFNENFLKKKNF
ncbi:actin [Balamuthia mandrillaris]